MKAYRGRKVIAPPILDLGTTWKWDISFNPRPLYTGTKISCCPLFRRPSGLQSQSRRFGKEKNFLAVAGKRTTGLESQFVTILPAAAHQIW